MNPTDVSSEAPPAGPFADWMRTNSTNIPMLPEVATRVIALAGSPDLIMKTDGYPPQLEMAALEGPTPTYGYHFAPYGYNLTFNGRHHNGLASDYVSPGLTVIAPSRKKK